MEYVERESIIMTRKKIAVGSVKSLDLEVWQAWKSDSLIKL